MPRRRTRCEFAFTMVELLIALAITALLLAAVAAAFDASVTSYRQNESIYQVVNNSRQALLRITSQIRTADAVDLNTPINECTLITADGRNITYRFNTDDQKLYLITNDDFSDDDYVLCHHVTSAVFQKKIGSEAGVVFVKSVQISLSVAIGNVQRTSSAAAVVRRNLR